MVGPPEDPEGETERTFDFIHRVKRVNPNAEIIVYIHTPLPAPVVPNAHRLKLAQRDPQRGQPARRLHRQRRARRRRQPRRATTR